MANEEPLAILQQGVEAWNRWRAENRITRAGAVDLKEADLEEADLEEADLTGADLSQANLRGARLSEANLCDAVLSRADLSGARLSGADLIHANLFEAELTGANLSGADLTLANLNGALLDGALLTQAKLGWTALANVDLSTVEGLKTVTHEGPSSIGIDTIYRSRGDIPEVFLRGAGVPDEFIEYMHSLTGRALEYYSCFISYSSRDEAFAQRLYSDLQSNNVRCWFAPEDMKIGAKIRVSIDESIRVHDKLLLVLSEHAVESDWVEQEVETALDRERKEKRLVLFPVRLDDTVMDSNIGWPSLIRNTRNIGDFRSWKEHDSYQKVFTRLLRDLKAAN